MRDVLAPPTRPAAFNLIKARVPLRMTSKFLKTPSSAAPSAWPSAIVRHAAPAAPAAPQFPQAMDGAQVMQALLGVLQGQLQPPAPPPNDDINLRFFPPARCGTSSGTASASRGTASASASTATASGRCSAA